jgi:hypothetical protein
MDVDVMLCDHAEAVEGKLFINGAAINLLFVGPEPPYLVAFSVAAVIQVPYTATNEPHTVVVRLVDEDGRPVVPWAPEGAPAPVPVELQSSFTLGRPPILPPGEAQTVPVAFSLQGLPLTRLGAYAVVVEIDGEPTRQLPFRVLTPTPPPSPGLRPTDLPRLS